MRVARVALLTLIALTIAVTRATADATAFIGTTSQPDMRRTLGFAGGFSILVFGFEFEYSHANEDVETGAPSLHTFMGNVLVQNPVPVAGIQFYGTIGAGAYRESFEEWSTTTFVGTNVGGGVKVRLAGPLRVRVDYRVFKLHGSARYDTPQRFYVGANFAF